MSDLPPALLYALKDAPGFDLASFVAVHKRGDRVNAIRINPLKRPDPDGEDPLSDLPLASPVPWSEGAYYLRERPAFFLDPLWHGGAYYVQDPSSMSIGFAIQHAAPPGPLRILDLCAAPGGKSTQLASVMPAGSLLVANEVIGSRTAVLEENLVKWGAPGVMITRNDPRDFGGLDEFFDVILIDAPCSGSGLFRKDPAAAAEWSPDLVELCSRRQQRITADVMGSLKPGGLLIYSTCSYSPLENEAIAAFLTSRFPLEPLGIPFDPAWGIVESSDGRGQGYRFYPDKLEGEGFFLSLFQKKGTPGERRPRKPSSRHRGVFSPLDKQRMKILAPWVKRPEAYVAGEWNGQLVLVTEAVHDALDTLSGQLRMVRAGCAAGKIVRDQFIPEHALAMSAWAGTDVPRIALSREEAISYLRKDPFMLPDDLRGWMMVTYQGVGLGWVKGVGGRVNNYYPTAWRIRKAAG